MGFSQREILADVANHNKKICMDFKQNQIHTDI